MTDRIDGLFVVLEEDIREDDIQTLVAAIKQLRNVLSVGLHISDHETYIAEVRVRADLSKKLWDALWEAK